MCVLQKNYLTANNESDEDERLDWSKLYSVSRRVLKCAPDLCYMASCDIVEKPDKKPRERRVGHNEQVGETKHPDKLANVSKEENSLDDTVRFIFWALNKEYKNNRNQGVNYFKFAMDPASFGQSVENCFHLSFLMRDTRVKMAEGR